MKNSNSNILDRIKKEDKKLYKMLLDKKVSNNEILNNASILLEYLIQKDDDYLIDIL